MKSFKLSKKSLHYHIATVYGNQRKYDDDTDLCSYISNVIGGLCFILFLTMIGGIFIGIILGNVVAWLTFIGMNGFIVPNDAAFAGCVVIVFVCGLFAIAFYQVSDFKRRVTKKIDTIITMQRTDSFLALVYRRFKDKTCVRLTLE